MHEPATTANRRRTFGLRPFSPIPGLTSLASAAAGLVLLAHAAGGDIAPAQPHIPSRKFSLADFGAVPDGKTSNSEAFRRAIAAVEKGGGGILVVPAGEYFTGPIDLCAKLDLRLERGARLVFSDEFSDYPQDGDEVHSLISARDCHDIALSGEGTIDGNGNAWWERVRGARAKDPIKHDDAAPRPHLIVFDRCQRVRLSGVTLTRSPITAIIRFRLAPGCRSRPSPASIPPQRPSLPRLPSGGDSPCATSSPSVPREAPV